ncbi:MAG: alginate lyase family protein [Pseudomonadota bacterium]
MQKLVLAGLLAVLPQVALACDPGTDPVIRLDYGSRYIDDDPSRSTIDAQSNAAVNAALKPIDDFIRDLVRDANRVITDPGDTERANCVVAQLAAWAEADALSDLDSFTARLSVGSRYAGFAFVYRQVRPYSTDMAARASIEDWLQRRIAEQMTFWEEEATPGAKRGNLRGWATLAVNLVAALTGDDAALHWSAASAVFLQCQAREDGSLPQETKRGRYGLHYQLHAVAPMVVTTALLEEQGHSIRGVCDNALDRIVAYTLADIETGAATAAYAGVTQTFFDGSAEFKPYQFAWLAAYQKLNPAPEFADEAARWSPLSHSKLGGRQELLWPAPGQ